MREERYQVQHGAQPSSSMILHAGIFANGIGRLCSHPPADDDETDLVAALVAFIDSYSLLHPGVARHPYTYTSPSFSRNQSRTPLALCRDTSHVGFDKVRRRPRSDNRRPIVNYCFLTDGYGRSRSRARSCICSLFFLFRDNVLDDVVQFLSTEIPFRDTLAKNSSESTS